MIGQRSRPASESVAVLSVVFICFLCCTTGQETPETDPNLPIQKLEDTVINDVLKIVDNKFDTLATRITALERAVSSFQLYATRHFQKIGGSLQSTHTDLDTVKKQVTQLETDTRAQNAVVDVLSRDISEIKKSSTDILNELESTVFYVNESVEKHSQTVKSVVEDTVFKSMSEATTQLSKRLDETMLGQDTQKTQPVHCLVDFTGISEHIDLRFAEFKMQTHAHFVTLINAAKLDLRRGARVDDTERTRNEKTENIASIGCNCKDEAVKDSGSNAGIIPKILNQESENRSENLSRSENRTTTTSSVQARMYQDENDERVMNALYNMTGSVLQAVSYFRNTGRILEQILSNTDSITIQQTDLSRRIGAPQDGRITSADGEELEQSNMISGAENTQRQQTYQSRARPAAEGCVLPTDVISDLATVIKNGSHLLEVLTDLAQLSSVSLTKATAALEDEVKRMEGIRIQVATTLLARASGDGSDPVLGLTNMTQKTFRLLEAVASNTGWLPQIFNNFQQLEALANRSFQVTMQNHDLLRLAQQNAPAKIASAESRHGEHNSSSDVSNRIHRAPGHDSSSTLHGDANSSSKEEGVLNRDSLETLYSTSFQLKRIMPALTKLLSEPDPLITLVGGGRPDQGRVEIYHNSMWGTLCHADLTHAEADLLCRHLGFRGGISAGSGVFGPGAGITWHINSSCLATSRCAVVSYTEGTGRCSHDLDAGVICDHMLRIVSSDGSTKGKVGRLEIHHRGMWLPVCGEGWSGYSARVACQQMGFLDGRETETSRWQAESSSPWLSKVACTGHEKRLDACRNDGWKDSCPGLIPAGVRCV